MMTGPEAEQTAARIAIHLRRNEFAICREILDDLESQQDPEEVCTQFTPIPIAEVLGDELRYVNMLEARGYIYMEDLDDVTLTELGDPACLLFIPYFGKKGMWAVGEGRKRAAEIRERRRRKQVKDLEEIEKVGEPLLGRSE